MRKIITIILLLGSVHSWAQEDIKIWNGFSITPAVGLRNLSLDVIRKSDGFTGNIAQGVFADLFLTLKIESPKLYFGEKHHWGVSVVNSNSFATMDQQWYSYDGTSTNGRRINVGSVVKGYYSYVVPQIFFEAGHPGSGMFKVALGFGLWNADLSGRIKLTAKDTPSVFGIADNIAVKTTKTAYLLSMSYRSGTDWLYEMSLGGPEFSDADYKYKVLDVEIYVGKTIRF